MEESTGTVTVPCPILNDFSSLFSEWLSERSLNHKDIFVIFGVKIEVMYAGTITLHYLKIYPP